MMELPRMKTIIPMPKVQRTKGPKPQKPVSLDEWNSIGGHLVKITPNGNLIIASKNSKVILKQYELKNLIALLLNNTHGKKGYK